MNEIKGQKQTVKEVTKVLKIFKTSDANIRPHFFLTGPSGSGKSFCIQTLCNDLGIPCIEINAAQLTKEGTSGNSVSKALGPLQRTSGNPAVCFVDEFDKLFISGNSNSDLAHESTNGVQNEFLKILESDEASVYGDYGKYINIPVSNILFIFAGSFNGEENIDLDRLRELGLKTEFLGRVGLIFNTAPLNLDTLFSIFDESTLFQTYLSLFKDVDEEEAELEIKQKIKEAIKIVDARIVEIDEEINQAKLSGNASKINTLIEKKRTYQEILQDLRKGAPVEESKQEEE